MFTKLLGLILFALIFKYATGGGVPSVALCFILLAVLYVARLGLIKIVEIRKLN